MENIFLISYPFECRVTSFDPERYYVRKRLESLISRQKYLSYINVFAEAGYGKSSFVYSFVSRKQIPTIWFDAGDFFPNFSAFIQNLAECVAMLTDTKESVPDEGQMAYVFHCFFQLESPIYLVIDHFQFIQQDEETLQFLNKLLSLNLPYVTLITISTECPPLLVTRLKTRGAYLELTKGDLALTYEEIEEFFSHYHDIFLEKYELDIIFRETEGWIAGCQLILLYLEQNLDNDNPRLRLNDVQTLPDIYDYINHEIFEKIPEDLRDFMVKTSLLKELDPDIINEYLGTEDAQEKLLCLQSHNFGLTKTKSSVFQYQHLLRLFLYEQYNQTHPDSIRNAHLRLSYIFEKRHRFLDAFTHAAASMNYQRAAELMHVIFFRYNSYQILHIIDGKLDEISPLLIPPDTTLFLTRCIPEEMLAEFSGPLEKKLEISLEEENYLNAAIFQHRLSSIYYQLGNIIKASEMANAALQSAKILKDYALAAYSHQLLADCCFEMNDEKASITHARQALFLTEKYQIRPIQLHCLEVLSRLQKDPEQADSYVSQAISLASPGSYATFWLYAAKSRVLRTSDPERAVTWARCAVNELSPYCCGYDAAYTNRTLGEAFLAFGKYDNAGKYLEIAYERSKLCALERLHTLEAQIKLLKVSGSKKMAEQKQEELIQYCVSHGYTWIVSLQNENNMSAPSEFPVLTIRVLGKFSVVQNGKPISFKRASSLRIFQFLITNRGTEKNRSIIAEEIFPNMKMDHLNHFHVALSALRKDLNPPESPKGTSPYIIRNRDRYRLNMEYIHLDADEFLRLSTEKCRTEEERITCLLKAEELYGGDYFEEYPYEYYLEAERERLRKIQIKNLYEIAEHYKQNREYAQAANYYEKIIRIDPYEENAYLECCHVMLKVHAVLKARKIAEKMIYYVEGEMGIPCRDRLGNLFRE